MKNVKKELLECLEGKPKVVCARLQRDSNWDGTGGNYYLLKCNYSGDDWENFLKSIDFFYDSGFGGQELFGTVWLQDGTWLTRGEYDGSEWWEYNKIPEIPGELL